MNGHVPFTNANNGRNFTAAHRARDTSGRERVDTSLSPPKVRFTSDTWAPSDDHSSTAKDRKLWLPPKSFCTVFYAVTFGRCSDVAPFDFTYRYIALLLHDFILFLREIRVSIPSEVDLLSLHHNLVSQRCFSELILIFSL